MSFALADLERRLANMVKIGTVEAVDHDNYSARVRFGQNVSCYLRWLAERAGEDRKWWAPSKGEQVLVISLSGDLTQGVIIGSLYSSNFSAPSLVEGVDKTEYNDGAVIEYDTNAHKLTATIPGDVSIRADGNVEAKAQGNMTGTAGDTLTMNAPKIILVGGLIQLAGPLVAAGLKGEVYSAEFSGNITQRHGVFTNKEGDVIVQGISSATHTHTERDAHGETSSPN